MNPVFPASRAPFRKREAFTLLELLVVISIIGVLAALTAPAINNMRKGDAMSAGVRQMLDAVSYARQRAIGDHTTVYMVFIPPAPATPVDPSSLNAAAREQFLQGQMTSYALFVKRQAGDQPGQGTLRYITPWRTLPEGIVIAPEKFTPGAVPISSPTGGYLSFDYSKLINGRWEPGFPFPDVNGLNMPLPYIAFDYIGSMKTGGSAITATIPLTRGSVMPVHPWGVDFRELPAGFSTNSYNHIVIDRLTGRARNVTRKIQ